MRSFTLVLVVLLALVFSGTARAADGPFDLDHANEVENARAMRNAGIGLTAAGLACEVVTIALWATTVVRFNDYHSQYGEHGPPTTTDLVTPAIATSVIAPMLLGVGIPLWAVGAHREKRARVTLSAAGELRF